MSDVRLTDQDVVLEGRRAHCTALDLVLDHPERRHGCSSEEESTGGGGRLVHVRSEREPGARGDACFPGAEPQRWLTPRS